MESITLLQANPNNTINKICEVFKEDALKVCPHPDFLDECKSFEDYTEDAYVSDEKRKEAVGKVLTHAKTFDSVIKGLLGNL